MAQVITLCEGEKFLGLSHRNSAINHDFSTAARKTQGAAETCLKRRILTLCCTSLCPSRHHWWKWRTRRGAHVSWDACGKAAFAASPARESNKSRAGFSRGAANARLAWTVEL